MTLPEDTKKTAELLRKAQTLSTTVLDEIHNLIYELRPSMLDELGLEPAVKSLVENSFKAGGVKVSLKTTGKVRRLPPQTEIALFRVFQEALTNIIKHARAHKARVSLNFRQKSLKIKIEDDGIGFNAKEVMTPGRKTRGLGLLGMKERVELIRGTLDIKSLPGEGTAITVEVPYDPRIPE